MECSFIKQKSRKVVEIGRKGKYDDWLTEDGLLQITGWVREGLTVEEIAQKRIGISKSTFMEWQKRFPEFLDAVKKGRAPVAEKIENNFYSRCEWQQIEETTVEITTNPNGTKVIHEKTVKKWVPPSDSCLIFALKNLKGWTNKPDKAEKEQLDKAAELLGGVESVIN